jgi:hypothetical protein
VPRTWVTQQARHLSWKLEDEEINLSVLIHDLVEKFASQADRGRRQGLPADACLFGGF